MFKYNWSHNHVENHFISTETYDICESTYFHMKVKLNVEGYGLQSFSSVISFDCTDILAPKEFDDELEKVSC